MLTFLNISRNVGVQPFDLPSIECQIESTWKELLRIQLDMLTTTRLAMTRCRLTGPSKDIQIKHRTEDHRQHRAIVFQMHVAESVHSQQIPEQGG